MAPSTTVPMCWPSFWNLTGTLDFDLNLGFPGSSAGKESAYNAGNLGSIPGLGRFPWRRESLPTPVFRPGEFHGLYSPWGRKESEWHALWTLKLIFSCLWKRGPFGLFLCWPRGKNGGRITTEPVPGFSVSGTHFLSLTRAVRTYFSPFLVSSLMND